MKHGGSKSNFLLRGYYKRRKKAEQLKQDNLMNQ
jgi:hypothetical protein